MINGPQNNRRTWDFSFLTGVISPQRRVNDGRCLPSGSDGRISSITGDEDSYKLLLLRSFNGTPGLNGGRSVTSMFPSPASHMNLNQVGIGKKLASRSTPVVIESQSDDKRLRDDNSSSVSIKASEYAYNMATWRMYHRIEARRANQINMYGDTFRDTQFKTSVDKTLSHKISLMNQGVSQPLPTRDTDERKEKDEDNETHFVQFDIDM